MIRTLQKYSPERRLRVARRRIVRGTVDQIATAANEMKTLSTTVSPIAHFDIEKFVHHHASVRSSPKVLEGSETEHHLDGQ